MGRGTGSLPLVMYLALRLSRGLPPDWHRVPGIYSRASKRLPLFPTPPESDVECLPAYLPRSVGVRPLVALRAIPGWGRGVINQYVAVMLQELDVRLEQAILTDIVQVGHELPGIIRTAPLVCRRVGLALGLSCGKVSLAAEI